MNMWRGIRTARYRGSMPRPSRVEPERQPASLRCWEGTWVAVDGEEVIAAAHNPRELAAKLHEMGPKASKAVARYVPKPSDDIVIGVG